jgi:hypothetical protein
MVMALTRIAEVIVTLIISSTQIAGCDRFLHLSSKLLVI